MTAPTEPLVTSLEEALRRLHENGRWLEPSMVGDGWVVHYWNDVTDEVEIHGAGATWPEAVSIALGRPVVARDSAADLEAELSKWRSAYVEVAGFLGMVSTDDTGRVGAVAGMEEVLAELEQREKDAAELRAALRRCSNLIQDFLDFGIAPVDRGPARHAVEAARAALAATEGEP